MTLHTDFTYSLTFAREYAERIARAEEDPSEGADPAESGRKRHLLRNPLHDQQ